MLSELEVDVIALRDHAKTCSWLSGYGAVSALARIFNSKSILEVGVAYGYHAIHLLETCPGISYVGIDPYISDYDSLDSFPIDVERLFNPQGYSGNEKCDPMTRLFNAVRESVRRVNLNASIERECLLRYFRRNPARIFDLIYIDGNHTDASVFSDIILALEHVSPSGLICGDDIERESVRAGLLKATDLYRISPKIYTHPHNGKQIWTLLGEDIGLLSNA